MVATFIQDFLADGDAMNWSVRLSANSFFPVVSGTADTSDMADNPDGDMVLDRLLDLSWSLLDLAILRRSALV